MSGTNPTGPTMNHGRADGEELLQVPNDLEAALSRALDVADLALERAERADSAKGRFLARMSHEVRTPLNSILGLTRLLLATGLDDTQRRYLEMVENSGRHLLAVLNQVLDFSKMEKGDLELAPVSFDLAALLREIFAPYAVQLELRGVNGRLQLAPDLPAAWHGDPARLRQIMANLLDNACKFTTMGTVTLRAEMVCKGGRHFLHCLVSDSGVGIPAGKIETIFAPFAQANGSVSRHYGGTGLGLAICRQLVELMGGMIWAESVAGQGAVFHFTIPAEQAPPRRQEVSGHVSEHGGHAVSDHGAPQDAAPRGRLPHILVVDDDYVNRLVTVEMIKELGWRVSPAADGREALTRLAAAGIDLVLMDIEMPVMDGCAAARAIRAKEGTDGKHLPLIALTGLEREEERAGALAAGFDDLLVKPVSAQALEAAISRLLPLHSPHRGKGRSDAPRR